MFAWNNQDFTKSNEYQLNERNTTVPKPAGCGPLLKQKETGTKSFLRRKSHNTEKNNDDEN